MMDTTSENSPARINNGPTEFVGGPPSLLVNNQRNEKISYHFEDILELANSLQKKTFNRNKQELVNKIKSLMELTLNSPQGESDTRDISDTEPEDEFMRMMRSPGESPFHAEMQDVDLSPTSINLEILETPSASNKRKKPETGVDTDAIIGRGDMNELNQLIHSEAEVLRDLFEQDKAAKRLTVQQRKDLNNAYDRIMSISRDMTCEYALLKGELNANEKRLKTLELELSVKSKALKPQTVSYAKAVVSKQTKDKPDNKVSKPKDTITKPGTFRTTQTIDKKLDAVRRAPKPREFLVKGGTDASQNKAELWKILNKSGPPKISGIKTLKNGSLLIRPACDETAKIIENLNEGGLTANKPLTLNPRILIYDVDREIREAELPNLIVDQNPELELDYSDITPSFRTGPKTGNTVWWVVEVTPHTYEKLTKKKRIYIGFMSCKVKEFLRLTRCFKCQMLGHNAANCKADSEVCGWCAVAGHTKKECPERDNIPKCRNCGKGFTSGHNNCPGKLRAMERLVRMTDYGKGNNQTTHKDD